MDDGRTLVPVIERGVEAVRILKWKLSLAVLAICAAPAVAQQSIQTAFNYNLADEEEAAAEEPAAESSDAPACGCEEPACGCEEASCCCEPSCGCSSCGNDWSCLGDCCLGEACTLQDYLDPCGCCDHHVGGWVQMGYHTEDTGLAKVFGDLFDFNDSPDDLRLHQAWVYGEKVAEAGACSADWGYRVDILYGIDAQKTQAFGNNDGTWDNTFDNGIYGWAIPQAYAEVAYGDWNFKIGHFWTLVGYEVVPATGNFFYSHSLTFFNSEPFTHTGVLGAYSLNDDTTVHLGWVLGWDTGFDQFDGGNAFHGGFIHQATDDVSVSYMCTAGNFGFRSAGEPGFEQAVVVNATLSECWNYVFETDWAHSDGFFDDDDFEADDIGIVNYLFYTLNDCWKAGGRIEWWKSNTVTGESTSFYELTGGFNYRPHANVVIRPEIRYDWTPSDEAVEDFTEEIFGIDAIFTF
jgi:hypothetical protein